MAPETPVGPNIQDSDAKKSAVWTYQDLLKTPHDEKLFDYYCTSQLAVVDLDGRTTMVPASCVTGRGADGSSFSI